MKKPNTFLSYSFGLMAGALGLLSTAMAQKNNAKTKVDISEDFSDALKKTFAIQEPRYLKTTDVIYYADSAKEKYSQVGRTTIITQRINDNEQLVIVADDADSSRAIDEDEVTLMIHYKADKNKVTAKSVQKKPEGDYFVNSWSYSTQPTHTLMEQFDCTKYPPINQWEPNRKGISLSEKDLLEPFVDQSVKKKKKPSGP